jgi:hypothetical protein
MEQRTATLAEMIVLSRNVPRGVQRGTVQQVILSVADGKGVSARENHSSESVWRCLFEDEFDRTGFCE